MKVSDLIKDTSYNHEEWKALGKRIRRDRGNACAICRRSDKLTHLHHWCYEPDKKLHEYADSEMALLCEDCHRAMHTELNVFRKQIFPLLNPRVFRLLNAALKVMIKRGDALKVAYAILSLAGRENTIETFAQWGAKEYGEQIQ